MRHSGFPVVDVVSPVVVSSGRPEKERKVAHLKVIFASSTYFFDPPEQAWEWATEQRPIDPADNVELRGCEARDHAPVRGPYPCKRHNPSWKSASLQDECDPETDLPWEEATTSRPRGLSVRHSDDFPVHRDPTGLPTLSANGGLRTNPGESGSD
ncbi:hypothetical protein NDU88_008072 [Pleurodeles waltl]|uniref:Uncharacterized protein n=1 Tax=Pleurodeles waltl TaxID=8319 RepID=A0AAV7RUR5_PLEWA|nr:hypothetical protein NDU88_008072 [Pleurodeles waltl]